MSCDHPSNAPKATPELIRAQQALLHTQPRRDADSTRKVVEDEQPPDRVASELEAAKIDDQNAGPAIRPAAPTAKPAQRRSQPSRAPTPAARPTQTEAPPTHHHHTHAAIVPPPRPLNQQAHITPTGHPSRSRSKPPTPPRTSRPTPYPNPPQPPHTANPKRHTDAQHERPNPHPTRGERQHPGAHRVRERVELVATTWDRTDSRLRRRSTLCSSGENHVSSREPYGNGRLIEHSSPPRARHVVASPDGRTECSARAAYTRGDASPRAGRQG
jgi:hypothetical protein